MGAAGGHVLSSKGGIAGLEENALGGRQFETAEHRPAASQSLESGVSREGGVVTH